MASNNDRTNTSPRDQLENLMNETFGERTARKLFKLGVAEYDPNRRDGAADLFEEYFYLSDEEAVDVCRGLISSLKPYASRRADSDGRPKSATGQRPQPHPNQPQNQPHNQNNNQNRPNRREPQHAEELELAKA